MASDVVGVYGATLNKSEKENPVDLRDQANRRMRERARRAIVEKEQPQYDDPIEMGKRWIREDPASPLPPIPKSYKGAIKQGVITSAGRPAADALVDKKPKRPTLPSDRMREEYAEWKRTDTASPIPPPSRSLGGLAMQGLLTATGRPLARAMQAGIKAGDREEEQAIMEELYGSEPGNMGIPEPDGVRRGTKGLPAHPEYKTAYQDAYDYYGELQKEGTLIGRGEDRLELIDELQDQENKLQDMFRRRARGFSREIGDKRKGGFPFSRYIPVANMIKQYNNGKPEEFDKFIKMLAEVRAKRQLLSDITEVRGGTVDREQSSELVRRAQEKAKRREERRRIAQDE